MLTDDNFDDLKQKGYTVVSNVMTTDECNHAIGQYREWLSQFKDGDWPLSSMSLIQKYNTGHMEPTWFARLKAKQVFAQVWKTEKLLSSVDAIAIGRPPEDGQEPFHKAGQHWLHMDQGSSRVGLHAYQGAVYLEAADEDDWTLHVLDGSHLHFKEFYETNERARIRTEDFEFYRLQQQDVEFYKSRNCKDKTVAVPKGGMVLWDSRLVHANSNPREGRAHAGRWRFCVFVSMTPAIWASADDMLVKKEAYDNVCMTTHWSSTRVQYSNSRTIIPATKTIEFPKTLPAIAKSAEAQRLAGAMPYDFTDGKPNGDDYIPKFRKTTQSESELRFTTNTSKTNYGLLFLKLLGIVIVGVAAVSVKRYLK